MLLIALHHAASLMKALVLDGSYSNDRIAREALQIVTSVLVDCGLDAEVMHLENMVIRECVGCFNCWIKTPGICVMDDEGRILTERMINEDLLVLITPIAFGGYSYLLKRAMERLIPALHPFFIRMESETHHMKRYGEYPALLVVGLMAEPDSVSEAIFRRLVTRNAINLHSPSSSTIVISSEDLGLLGDKVDSSLEGMGMIQ